MARTGPVDFAAGQLSHLGKFYDIEMDGVLFASSSSRWRPVEPTPGSPFRNADSKSSSAPLSPRGSQPAHGGVTHALRTLLGRPMGDDSPGEWLDLGDGHDRVHMFDAFAMANIRLCTSVKAGTTNSRPTPVMTRNCVRHLSETIRILQPTVCVVQGTDIPRALAPIVTHRRMLTPHLAEVQISGVRTLMAEFSHPTAWGEQNWGRWSNMPYLRDTVIPTLKEARTSLGLPTSTAPRRRRRATNRFTAAPHVNVSAQPNDRHTHTVITESRTSGQSQLYWKFWLEFRERVAAEHPDWKARAGTSRTSPNATLPTGAPRAVLCSAFKPGPYA